MTFDVVPPTEGSHRVLPRPMIRPGQSSTRGMRVAIIHYWLVGMRGGEKVLESLLRMFPDADIVTHVYDPARVSPLIRRHKVITTSINRLPFADRKSVV